MDCYITSIIHIKVNTSMWLIKILEIDKAKKHNPFYIMHHAIDMDQNEKQKNTQVIIIVWTILKIQSTQIQSFIMDWGEN